MISNFVACKACKKIYAFKPNDGTQSLRKHNAVKIGVCGYTRTRGYTRPDPLIGRTTTGSTGNGYTRGSGRVGSGPVENLTYGYGSGRVVKTVYPQTPSMGLGGLSL